MKNLKRFDSISFQNYGILELGEKFLKVGLGITFLGCVMVCRRKVYFSLSDETTETLEKMHEIVKGVSKK